MSFRKFLYLALATLSEVMATVLLKNMKGVLKFYPCMGIAIVSLAGFYFLFLAIRMMPMGVAYAIWSGAGIILVALSEVIIYEEPLAWIFHEFFSFLSKIQSVREIQVIYGGKPKIQFVILRHLPQTLMHKTLKHIFMSLGEICGLGDS